MGRGGRVTNEEVQRLTEAEQRCKSNTHRLDKAEERQDNLDALVTSVATLATEQEHIKEDVTEIKSDVKTLTGKSGKRWDELIDKIIWAIVAAGIGFLLARLGIQ
ncbi:MAG: hypothetical protein VB064_04785 [Oscillospiraceae bacterium]|nr:hypothetical protein [Oscillospiraceae bacterium]